MTLFRVLTHSVQGYMCNGTWEFQTENMRVSVWSFEQVVGSIVFHFKMSFP